MEVMVPTCRVPRSRVDRAESPSAYTPATTPGRRELTEARVSGQVEADPTHAGCVLTAGGPLQGGRRRQHPGCPLSAGLLTPRPPAPPLVQTHMCPPQCQSSCRLVVAQMTLGLEKDARLGLLGPLQGGPVQKDVLL